MIADPLAVAGLVTRELRSGEREGATTKIAVARRTYPTDAPDLWDALTNAERLPRWFAPVTGELELGGRYQVEGNAGGVVERCDAPKVFAVTWEMGPQMSWLEVSLIPTDDGTTLELLHEAVLDEQSVDFWRQFGPGAVGVGWDLALLGLGLHIESGEPVDMEGAMSLTFTPEGKAFVAAASSGWADAAVADGEDRTQADEAAARTVAFYTTMPEDAGEPPAEG